MIALSIRQTFNGQRVLRISDSATWNIRNLLGDGRLENLIKEIDRLKISIHGVSSTQCNDTSTFAVNNGEYNIYRSSSNNQDQNHNYGIAIIVNK